MSHLEIKLRETDLECLKRMLPQAKMLELPISRDQMKHMASTEAWPLDPENRPLDRAEVFFEAKQEILLRKRKEFFDWSREMGLEHSDYETWTRILNANHPKMYVSFLQNMAELNVNNDVLSEIWSRNMPWRTRKVRNLFGIIGIVQVPSSQHAFAYGGYLIPPENILPVEYAIQKGVFIRDIEPENLEVLEHLYKRTWAIRKGKAFGHNPRISARRISDAMHRSYADIRSSLDNLGGAICHTYGPKCRHPRINGETKAVYLENWYIPHRRMRLVEELLT